MDKDKVEYLTTNQVSQRLGLKNSDDVGLLIRNNQFPNAIKQGHRWRIPISDLNKYKKRLNETASCLTIKQATERLGYKSGNGTTIIDLIKKSILPNAFKSNGQWWIPKSDIEHIEEKQLESLDTSQASQRLNLKSAHYVSILINKKEFPNAFKDFSGRWRIPHGDIKEYEIKSNVDKTVGTLEAAKKLDYKSKEAINHLLYDNQFPNAFKFQGVWRIPVSDIEEYIRCTDGCLDTKQAAERLGYKATFTITQLIERSILPNGFKLNGKWWIPESDIESIEKSQSESLDANQTVQRLQIKSKGQVIEMIHKSTFPNAFKDIFGVWRIPLKDIAEFERTEFERSRSTDNSIDINEASKRLGYKSPTPVKGFLRDNYFPNAFKSGRKLWIPLTDFEDFQSTFQNREKPKREKKAFVEKDPKTIGCLNTTDLQKKLKVSKNIVMDLLSKGNFINGFKYKGRWWVPEADIEDYQKRIEKKVSLKLGSLSVDEVADRLGYADKGALSPMITKQNKFPNAFKIGVSWRIPVTDVEEFEKIMAETKKKIDYTPKVAFTELKGFVEAIGISEHLRETKDLYLQYCLLQLNNMGGTTRYKRDRVLLFKRLYKSLVDILTNEVYLISIDEISGMLNEKSSIRKDEKKMLIPFLRYVYNQKNIEPEQQFSLMTTVDNTVEQEIYSPELFHDIYQYVKDLKSHILPALKERSYANMWVYTILLLTDFIRGQDLILNTPKIDLEAVDIDSLDWFIENKLSESQAQSIVNQLYIHFRYKRASKTDELLTFIVAPDLIAPLATGLIISELHRRFDQSEVQLDTFLEGVFNTIKTSGKRRHREFFEGMKNASEFRFSSLKMNRSVATYLFYSVTEDDGNDSELALHLTQVSRSHKSSDSTSAYIQATNKDGTINRVSYNLFKRGHFGWLYNYLILYVSQFEGTQDTLEQRSKLIEEVRKEISPLDLESVAEFINNNLAPMPLNRKSDSMDVFLQNIYKKRQTVISKLNDYSKEEIREIITKLANGDLPSKNEHAQCLVAPKCKNPKLTNCFSCEYVIPGNLMLIQLNEELNRLLVNIENATNEVIMQRESKFLMHTLFIWKEARIEFGDEKVNVYISAEEKWKKIEEVAHKLIIE